MRVITIKSETIRDKLKKLNHGKSPGPDGIHPRVLNELSNSISEALCVIFNTSIRTSTLPDDWLTAHVSAIYKKGSRKLSQNYRPISLTCIC
jgi:hypothetical protein